MPYQRFQEQTMFWLVVWNIFYFPSYMGIIIIPSDFHIFQDDWHHQPVLDYKVTANPRHVFASMSWPDAAWCWPYADQPTWWSTTARDCWWSRMGKKEAERTTFPYPNITVWLGQLLISTIYTLGIPYFQTKPYVKLVGDVTYTFHIQSLGSVEIPIGRISDWRHKSEHESRGVMMSCLISRSKKNNRGRQCQNHLCQAAYPWICCVQKSVHGLLVSK